MKEIIQDYKNIDLLVATYGINGRYLELAKPVYGKSYEYEHMEYSVLGYAIIYNAPMDVIDTILKTDGVNVNAKQHNKVTPLMLALLFNRENAIKRLLADKRTDLKAKVAVGGGEYTTVLDCCKSDTLRQLIQSEMDRRGIKTVDKLKPEPKKKKVSIGKKRKGFSEALTLKEALKVLKLTNSPFIAIHSYGDKVKMRAFNDKTGFLVELIVKDITLESDNQKPFLTKYEALKLLNVRVKKDDKVTINVSDARFVASVSINSDSSNTRLNAYSFPTASAYKKADWQKFLTHTKAFALSRIEARQEQNNRLAAKTVGVTEAKAAKMAAKYQEIKEIQADVDENWTYEDGYRPVEQINEDIKKWDIFSHNVGKSYVYDYEGLYGCVASEAPEINKYLYAKATKYMELAKRKIVDLSREGNESCHHREKNKVLEILKSLNLTDLELYKFSEAHKAFRKIKKNRDLIGVYYAVYADIDSGKYDQLDTGCQPPTFGIKRQSILNAIYDEGIIAHKVAVSDYLKSQMLLP